MKDLLYKDLKLSMHPTMVIFLLLSAMLLIPNYPYYTVFFYDSLAVFYMALSGRENRDAEFTLSLPVSCRDIVDSRIMFTALYELVCVVCTVPFAILRSKILRVGNAVGMDANLAFYGFSLVLLGIFNYVFFNCYYRDVKKVGVSFIWASTAEFVFIAAAETCDHVLPFLRDRLDTPDPEYLGEKLIVLAAGAAVFAALTYLAAKRSEKTFERLDF